MKRLSSLTLIKKKRNQKLRRYFAKLQLANPRWRYDALLEDTAARFYISPRTVKAILNKEGKYAN